MKDQRIRALLKKEEHRQGKTLNLIASENTVSDEVRFAMGSIATNKYAEGKPRERYYAGCEIIDEIEILAQERAKKLFGAGWVNVQPHSGTQANLAVLQALVKPGETVMGLSLKHGGHLSHGSKVNASGKLYRGVSYELDPKTEKLNYSAIEQLAVKEKPRVIFCGASAYSQEWDYKKLRRIADKVGAFLIADIAHTAGLIAAKQLASPINDAHIITTTTHKTLRGPRGGMILMKKDFSHPDKTVKKTIAQLIDSAVFPGTQGGPLEHQIAAKAVCFGEALSPAFTRYAKQVMTNAKALANELEKRGYRIVSGGTINHLFLVDLTNKELNGDQAQNKLEEAGIIVNKNLIPFDTKSAQETSGIRIGTPTITSRGLMAKDMVWVANCIDAAINSATRQQRTSIKKFVQLKLKSIS